MQRGHRFRGDGGHRRVRRRGTRVWGSGRGARGSLDLSETSALCHGYRRRDDLRRDLNRIGANPGGSTVEARWKWVEVCGSVWKCVEVCAVWKCVDVCDDGVKEKHFPPTE